MSKNELIKAVENAISGFQEQLSLIDERQLNNIPYDGSWTAGQLAQHMRMANSGFVEVINGPVKETERAADAQVESIRQTFLNFGLKMDAPDFVVPEMREYDKDSLLKGMEKVKKDVLEAIEVLDLDKTCTAFELPVYGYLTRLEAIAFIIYHTQRHAQQLGRIRESLGA